MSSKSSNRRAHLRSLVSEWPSSGQTQKAFCAQHDIPLSTFSYWWHRYRATQQAPEGFVALPVSGEACGLEIHYPTGVCLKAPLHTDVNLLKTLLGAYPCSV